MVHPTLPMSPYESGVFLGFSASSTPLSTHRAPKHQHGNGKNGQLKASQQDFINQRVISRWLQTSFIYGL